MLSWAPATATAPQRQSTATRAVLAVGAALGVVLIAVGVSTPGVILLCVSLGMAWVPWARREWSALRRGRQPTRLPDGSITPMEAARMDAYQVWFSSGGGGGDAGGGGGGGGGG